LEQTSYISRSKLTCLEAPLDFGPHGGRFFHLTSSL